jgi:hypothetical protein
VIYIVKVDIWSMGWADPPSLCTYIALCGTSALYSVLYVKKKWWSYREEISLCPEQRTAPSQLAWSLIVSSSCLSAGTHTCPVLFEILTSVIGNVTVFRIITRCTSQAGRRFRATYRLHLEDSRVLNQQKRATSLAGHPCTIHSNHTLQPPQISRFNSR